MTLEQKHDRVRPLKIRDQAHYDSLQEVGEHGKNDAPPRARDPLALAGVTVQAVDQIGESAAHEIEQAAAAVEEAAGEIGTKLRKLAAGVREHSKIAGEQVAEFVGRSTNVIETIRALQERLDGPKKGNGGG
jgi:TPP-dependent pyruvate/acetoin dehydrogenase alpha subunit